MKNKHAKGPDGQPLININSGRGRGRPKKNASAVRFSHVEPTSDSFFKASNDRAGGPCEPVLGFKEVYTEIYIKRAKRPPVEPLEKPPLFDENGNPIENNQGDEEGSDLEEEKKDDGTTTNINGAQASNQQPTEKIKKKRGRKPKSFYIQQQQEQERIAREQAELRKQELQDLENEEEVKLRADEYKTHPLFGRLSQYTEELKDFIEEKRKKQAELQQQREQEKQSIISVGGYPSASSILFSYADVMKVGGNIFCT